MINKFCVICKQNNCTNQEKQFVHLLLDGESTKIAVKFVGFTKYLTRSSHYTSTEGSIRRSLIAHDYTFPRHAPKVIERVRNKNSGRKRSEESRTKMRVAHYNRLENESVEDMKRRSENSGRARKGKKPSAETNRKVSQALKLHYKDKKAPTYGRVLSESSKQLISRMQTMRLKISNESTIPEIIATLPDVSEKMFQRLLVNYAQMYHSVKVNKINMYSKTVGFPDLTLTRHFDDFKIHVECKPKIHFNITENQFKWWTDWRASDKELAVVWIPDMWLKIKEYLERPKIAGVPSGVPLDYVLSRTKKWK